MAVSIVPQGTLHISTKVAGGRGQGGEGSVNRKLEETLYTKIHKKK